LEFSNIILYWYTKNKRDFPWRKSKNTYKVWLSEIILQQTQTSQGLSYYNKIINTFPTLKELAEASEEKILKLWQGLGYYSRARNLHYTAKYIQNNFNGVFPDDYNSLIKLKGIGPYTAAAISSICFNKKRAAVDGNVYRILARVFNIDTAINSTEGIKTFQELANSLISETNPGDYNQSMMDLGATICTPKNPKCNQCPLESICLAHGNSTIYKLPVKMKKTKIKHRYFHYFCIDYNGKFLMKKRTKKDIWRNLYDFPLIELDEISKESNIDYKKLLNSILENGTVINKNRKHYDHQLTHQKLNITIEYIKANKINNDNDFLKVNRMQVKELPVPKPIERFFEELFNSLDCKI
tara:strand:- start:293 stop:1354 length:1062 start_codon:yes stop_codon:yes gene_type:complete